MQNVKNGNHKKTNTLLFFNIFYSFLQSIKIGASAQWTFTGAFLYSLTVNISTRKSFFME